MFLYVCIVFQGKYLEIKMHLLKSKWYKKFSFQRNWSKLNQWWLKQEQISAHGPRKIYFSPVFIIYWNRLVLVLSINSFNVVISLIKQDLIFKCSISSKFILLENKTKILSKILHYLCSSFFLVHAIFHAMIFCYDLRLFRALICERF